jgi:hypothetical protein
MVNFVDTVIRLLTDSLINCTNKNDLPPAASEHLSRKFSPYLLTVFAVLSDIDTPYVLALCIATLVFMLTSGLFILHLVLIGRYCNDFYRRAFVLFLASTPPFISFFALVALFMPRVWFLSYLLSFFYFSLAIYVTVCLLLQLMDGRQALVSKMTKNSTNITITT